MIVKDEADIVGQALKSALRWSDTIFVFDNGSSDGTTEILTEMSQDHPQITIWGSDSRPYTDAIRSEIYRDVRSCSSPEDWWCKLDADEIYIDNPQVFLRKVPKRYGFVLSASFQYYFTEKDAEKYASDPDAYAAHVPIEQKIRYYLNNYSEERFSRETIDGAWEDGLPTSRRPAYPVRIWLKHYQYRSPSQIMKRMRNREGISTFRHETMESWRARNNAVVGRSDLADSEIWKSRLVRSDALYLDSGDSRYVPREDLMRPVPPVPLADELSSVSRRAVRGAGMRGGKWLRRAWTRGA